MEEAIKKISNLIEYIENADYVDASQCFDCEDIEAIKKLLKQNKKLKEKNKKIKWERNYYKLRFEELNKQWNKVIHKLLGENYYNYGCDWKTCDKFTADDLIYKYKKRWWQFWKKI